MEGNRAMARHIENAGPHDGEPEQTITDLQAQLQAEREKNARLVSGLRGLLWNDKYKVGELKGENLYTGVDQADIEALLTDTTKADQGTTHFWCNDKDAGKCDCVGHCKLDKPK